MNRLILTIVMVFALLSMASVDAKDADVKNDQAAQTQRQAPDVAGFDKQLARMQENFKKMQDQMDKIRQTTDAKERQKLLQEHWMTMQNAMGIMQGMWDTCMMGWPMMSGGRMGGHMMMGYGMMMGGNMAGWNNMHGYYSKLTPDQVKQRQYMIDQYMGMQQMMMNQNYMWPQQAQ